MNWKFLSTILLSVLIGGSVLVGVSFFAVQADTNVIGIINSDSAWTKAKSPYVLTGPVAVNTGVTLMIEAGVQVNLMDYYLQVNGTLVAKGTNTDRINITDGEIIFTELSTSWEEQSGSGCIVENTDFDGITIRNTSLKIADSSGDIKIYGGSTIISNSEIGLTIYGGSPVITHNIIAGPVTIISGSPMVSQNTINGGISFGTISSFDVPNLNDRPVITNNYISSWDVLIKLSGCSPLISNNILVGLTMDFGPRRGYFGELYGTYSADYGINFDGGTASIINNKILNCTVAGINVITGNVTVERNLIYNCGNGIHVGTSTSDKENAGTQVTIRENTVASTTLAIKLDHAPPTTINYNNIQNYSQSINLISTAIDIDATNNWWGTTDTEAISVSIFDFEEDFNLGKVIFSPFLTEPNPEAPEIPPTPTPTPAPSPSVTPSITPSPTASPTSIPTPSPEPQQTEFTTIIGATIVFAVLSAGLGLLLYLIKRK